MLITIQFPNAFVQWHLRTLNLSAKNVLALDEFFEPEIDFNYLKWKVPRYVRIHNIPFSFFLHRTVSRRKWEYLEIKKVEEGRNTWQLPTRWDHWLFIIIIYKGLFVCVVRCNLDLSYLSGSKLTLSIIEKNCEMN